jgi:hypothetical protein
MADIKELIAEVNPELYGKKSLRTFEIVYDSPSSQLEAIYFWILDYVEGFGFKIEKITDNFSAAPGSGHFAEIGARATRMQEEGMKILGTVNQVIKTILNLVYDLKEFKIRLKQYEQAKSKDEQQAEAGLLGLKQIWMDNVDMKRGRGSINQLTYELSMTTLRDAFMAANSLEDAKKMEIINDRVKRVLIPRLSEFFDWRKLSEKELEKRFKIEQSYLKTEVESLKLYTSWVRPYLKAAEELRMKGFENDPALVSAFNTARFEMTLFGKRAVKKDDAVNSGDLPIGLANYNVKRGYNSCFILNFKFRGFPQKVTQQNYGFGGRIELTFDAYSLNDEEIKLINKKMGEESIEEGISFVQKNTDESLEQLKEDLDDLLKEDPKEEKKEGEKKENPDDINPFSALIGLFNPSTYGLDSKKDDKKKDGEIKEAKDIKKDNYVEEYLRNLAMKGATDSIYSLYDDYKKVHGMESSIDPFESDAHKNMSKPSKFSDIWKKSTK